MIVRWMNIARSKRHGKLRISTTNKSHSSPPPPPPPPQAPPS
jgi:hypothetical protein